MFSTNGSKIIEKALDQFEGVKRKLNDGIEQCKAKISRNEAVMVTLQAENAGLATSAQKAEKAIQGIDKLLNGG